MKRGVDAPGSGGRRRGRCADGPRRKTATEDKRGLRDGDICNDSRADGAGVTRETYV